MGKETVKLRKVLTFASASSSAFFLARSSSKDKGWTWTEAAQVKHQKKQPENELCERISQTGLLPSLSSCLPPLLLLYPSLSLICCPSTWVRDSYKGKRQIEFKQFVFSLLFQKTNSVTFAVVQKEHSSKTGKCCIKRRKCGKDLLYLLFVVILKF